MGHKDKDNCGDCGRHHDDCVCKKSNNFGCAFKTAGIIGVVLIVVIAAASFTTIGINNIYNIAEYDANIFGNPAVRADSRTLLRQQAATQRAADYLKSLGTFLWLDIMAAIVPIALLCCMNSMCKDNDGRYFWFTRFGFAGAVLILILVAQGIATLYFTSRATHLAGWILLFTALVSFLSALCLGANWRMVIQLTIAFLCLGVALYLLVISPSYQTIMGVGSMAVVP